MTDIERNDVVEMAARTRCTVCKTPYGRRGVQVLGRRGGAWVIAVACTKCGAAGRMFASVDEAEADAAVSMGRETAGRPRIMYDVTYDEWLAAQKRSPISCDDVLNIHLFLRDFDGDFARLFGEERNIEDALK